MVHGLRRRHGGVDSGERQLEVRVRIQQMAVRYLCRIVADVVAWWWSFRKEGLLPVEPALFNVMAVLCWPRLFRARLGLGFGAAIWACCMWYVCLQFLVQSFKLNSAPIRKKVISTNQGGISD